MSEQCGFCLNDPDGLGHIYCPSCSTMEPKTVIYELRAGTPYGPVKWRERLNPSNES